MGNMVSEKIKRVWQRIKHYMKMHQDVDMVSTTAKNVSHRTDETSASNATTLLPENSSVEDVEDPLSPDDTAAVKDYVHRFACMSRFASGLEPEIQIKAFMLGQYEVGMSCLATRFVRDAWLEGINPCKYGGSGFRLRKLLYGKHMLLDMRVE